MGLSLLTIFFLLRYQVPSQQPEAQHHINHDPYAEDQRDYACDPYCFSKIKALRLKGELYLLYSLFGILNDNCRIAYIQHGKKQRHKTYEPDA
jgi:hypothetical protein